MSDISPSLMNEMSDVELLCQAIHICGEDYLTQDHSFLKIITFQRLAQSILFLVFKIISFSVDCSSFINLNSHYSHFIFGFNYDPSSNCLRRSLFLQTRVQFCAEMPAAQSFFKKPEFSFAQFSRGFSDFFQILLKYS